MFADVRNFTALSERTPVAELRRSLNVFFAAASDILVRNDALVDKFMGDAVMALFNAPIPQQRHREMAMQSAIELLERIERLGLNYQVGVGLNTGMAITGNVGAGEITDYTAIGDTVNIASRLSGLAPGGEILAGDSTCEDLIPALPTGWTCEKASVEVKGKERPLVACRVYKVNM
ncbi:MAG: adenylate/guanylate cyclase domain-containing protein [Chloroflexi bacterium]|nr:adenylate/guanylate cyclase domain-containing protein [Chloroflexota bacterium]